MSEDLKPCPFCGSQGHLEEIEPEFTATKTTMFAAACSNEGCGAWILAHKFDRRTDAIKAWNTRAALSDGGSEVGRLITAFKDCPKFCAYHDLDNEFDYEGYEKDISAWGFKTREVIKNIKTPPEPAQGDCNCTKCKPTEIYGERERYWGPCFKQALTQAQAVDVEALKQILYEDCADDGLPTTVTGERLRKHLVSQGYLHPTEQPKED